MNVVYVPRSDVGYNTSLPRLGHAVARSMRTNIVLHHTVGADSDATINLWETLAECKGYARRLQTVRAADLGKDVPYNFVVFFTPGTLYVIEGRGWDRTGAHTRNYNTAWIAFSWAGDFRIYGGISPAQLTDAVTSLGVWARAEVRRLGGFTNLNPTPKGHRDAKNTSCPGDLIYNRRTQFKAGWNSTTPPPPPPPPPPTTEETMKQGDTGQGVTQFQLALKEWRPKIDLGTTGDNKDGVDGKFGPKTTAAVKTFQKAMNRPQTGIIDGITGSLLATWRFRRAKVRAVADNRIAKSKLTPPT